MLVCLLILHIEVVPHSHIQRQAGWHILNPDVVAAIVYIYRFIQKFRNEILQIPVSHYVVEIHASSVQ